MLARNLAWGVYRYFIVDYLAVDMLLKNNYRPNKTKCSRMIESKDFLFNREMRGILLQEVCDW